MNYKPPEPRAFFEKMIPAALRENRALATSHEGRITFCVTGLGAWTVRLGRSPSIAPAGDLDAELLLFFSEEAFDLLLAGKAPTMGQGFTAAGDEALLEVLGQILTLPVRGLVSLRAANY